MRAKFTKGFSLVELLTVIAIISIVGSIASWGWHSYKNNADLRMLARELSADIAGTKQKAIRDGLCYRINISLSSANNKYTVEKGDNGNCINVITFTEVLAKSPISLGLIPGQHIKSTTYGSNFILFETRGTTSAGNVILENSKGSQATITSNITGKTYVKFNMH